MIEYLKTTLKYILLIFIVILTSAKLFVTVMPYDWATGILVDIFELPGNFFEYEEPYHKGIYGLSYLYHNTYRVIVLLSAIFSILGVIILYKGRTVLETLMLFNFLAIPKQRKGWGKVIDINSKEPIALAILRIYEFSDLTKEFKFQSQYVSDFEGRYKIKIPNILADHKIEVRSSDYSTFERVISARELKLSNGLIVEDIALTLAETTSSFKSRFYEIRPKIYIIFLMSLFFLSFVNFLRSFYGIFIFPQTASFIEFLLYFTAFGWNVFVMTDRLKNENPQKAEEVEIVNPFS